MTTDKPTRNARFVDLSGKTFGRIEVLDLKEINPDGHAVWLCRCRCGSVKPISGKLLRNGHTTSCGCAKRERGRAMHLTHGLNKTPEHTLWLGMVSRATNPKHKSFKDYSARGIGVAPEWRGDGGFMAFLTHIGPRPSPKHTIERIDNEKGYELGNVRWATRTEQARNKRNNRFIEFAGRRQTLAEWAIEVGIHSTSLAERLAKWPLERALTEAPRGS